MSIPPKKILYPLNLDSKKIVLLNRIFIIAKAWGASVDILYVNDEQAGYRHASKTEVDVKNAIGENSKPELLQDVSVTYHVAKGTLNNEVKKYCDENGIDLIITGHKHHNKLYAALFDTPEESIIDTVNIPVLVIPKSIAETETDVTDIELG